MGSNPTLFITLLLFIITVADIRSLFFLLFLGVGQMFTGVGSSLRRIILEDVDVEFRWSSKI